MIEIRLVCNQEKLTPAEKPVIASGDVNSVQLRVDFCQKWDRYAKSAVFFAKDDPTPIEMPLAQNVCLVPAEVLAESGTFYVGIRGVNADDATAAILTSDIIGYRVVNGAPSGVEIGPTPDVYQQILTGYGKMDANKQNKLAWVSDADIDAMFAGTYVGEEDEDPEGDGYLPGGTGPALANYYTTPREEIGVAHEAMNTAYIFGLYDALMEEHPDNVQKKEVYSDDGAFITYEYVISTGEYPINGAYNAAGIYYGADPHIRKPKYLILNAIHGIERKTTISTYRFIRDILESHNVSPLFREGVNIHIIPVGNPSGFNAHTRTNADDVDINRDFHKIEKGTAAKETQAIANWLAENKNADLFIDFHNSSYTNEIGVIIGCSPNDTIDEAKKIALRGIDQIVPFWKTIIPDEPVLTPVSEDENGKLVLEERNVIFPYSVALSYPKSALAVIYATNELGIPSIAIEAPVYIGDYFEEIDTKPIYQPEALALGSEIIGNVLLEFYSQALAFRSDALRKTNVTPTYDGEVVLTKNTDTQSRYYNGEVK